MKSPKTPRPKMDTQEVGLVCMSPRNPQFGKFFMEYNGKNIKLETDDEEDELQVFVDEIQVDEEMKEDIQPVQATKKMPEYVPLWKWKAKVSRDLDVDKSALQTPLL